MSEWTEEEEKKFMPWCLCGKKWYRILFSKNPLHCNDYYWFGWVDPESWLEWLHFGAPVRFYYWKRNKWIDFPFTQRRGVKMWESATPISPKKLNRIKGMLDDDDLGRSKNSGEDL